MQQLKELALLSPMQLVPASSYTEAAAALWIPFWMGSPGRRSAASPWESRQWARQVLRLKRGDGSAGRECPLLQAGARPQQGWCCKAPAPAQESTCDYEQAL